jgi:hypothetical protein
MSQAKDRMIRLELKHAAAAIERTALLSAGLEFECDIRRLLEAARARLDGDRRKEEHPDAT